MKVTGETITDAQIGAVRDETLAIYHDQTKPEAEQLAAWSIFTTCIKALSGELGYRGCDAARSRIADLINVRSGITP